MFKFRASKKESYSLPEVKALIEKTFGTNFTSKEQFPKPESLINVDKEALKNINLCDLIDLEIVNKVNTADNNQDEINSIKANNGKRKDNANSLSSKAFKYSCSHKKKFKERQINYVSKNLDHDFYTNTRTLNLLDLESSNRISLNLKSRILFPKNCSARYKQISKRKTQAKKLIFDTGTYSLKSRSPIAKSNQIVHKHFSHKKDNCQDPNQSEIEENSSSNFCNSSNPENKLKHDYHASENQSGQNQTSDKGNNLSKENCVKSNKSNSNTKADSYDIQLST